MTKKLTTLREYVEIVDDVDALDAILGNDDVVDRVSEYDITYDEAQMLYRVSLYDDSGVNLASVMVEDPEVAEVYLDEVFGIETVEDRDSDSVASASPWGHGGDVDKRAIESPWGHDATPGSNRTT